MADGTPGVDPLGAASLRTQVLAGWTASPARFREDANAEEDLALGGYHDALVVELVQNAVDAAGAAGVPARVLLRLRGDVLECANTGTALTAEGLQSLATLRASAKRDDDGAVGRFGVGFAAVLAVTDEPVIISGDAAIGFSLTGTRALVQEIPALQGELARRGGGVPVLRLPFALPAQEPPPAGCVTVVRLPLRDPAAARELLAAIDPTLPLVLPGLTELTVDDGVSAPRVLRAEYDEGAVLLDGRRWLLAEADVAVGAELAGGGRVEERGGGRARVRALVPADGEWPPEVERVLRAPQPTEERLRLPVLLSVPVPLEPSRRRTLPGPVRDLLLDRAADAVADLAARIDGPGVLRLVPTGLPASEVDARLGAALLVRLRAAPPLPGMRLLDLGRATAAVHAVLEGVLDGLLPLDWPSAGAAWSALAALGVERLDTAAVVDALAGVDRPPGWWRQVYEALAAAPDREALAALPVPLADGRRAPGPRGLLLATEGLDPHLLQGLEGIRLVHPDAASPVLLTLGAIEAGPRVVLEELRPRVEASLDDDDLSLAAVVLPLVAASRIEPGELAWLSELALPDSDGEPAPAGELVLAGGALARVLLPDGPLGVVEASLQDSYGAAALAACGVADGLVPVRGDEEVSLLDDGERWLAEADPVEPAGVRDLELLAWPEALALLPGVPPQALPYARWWCNRHPVLGGRLPAEVLHPQADPLLVGLYDPPPPGVEAALLALLACRRELPVDDDDLLDLLDRLGDDTRVVTRVQLRALHAHVARLAPVGEPPLTVRGVGPGGGLVVVPAADAVVVDRPDLLPLLGSRVVVPVAASLAAGLARLLDVPPASSLGDFTVVGEDPLLVLDADGRPTPVPWRITPDGVVHATTPEGRGRALAWRDGRWRDRLGEVERLRDPAAAVLLDAEDDLAG